MQLKTLAQAGAELGLAPDTLRRQVHKGKIRATLAGKTWLVSDAEIARYRRESLGRVGRTAKL